MCFGSENTIAVPAINVKRYLGVTVVRYINFGKASKIQTNSDWDLGKTNRQVEQKFATVCGGKNQRQKTTKNADMQRKKNLRTSTI